MSRTKIAALLVLAGIAVTGGSAFTAGLGNNVPATSVIGSKLTTVSGANATSVAYNYSADYSQVDSIDVVFPGDISTETLLAIPNGVGANALTCDANFAAGSTTFNCDATGVGDQPNWTTAGLTSIRYLLTD